jgi:hypothetical protein
MKSYTTLRNQFGTLTNNTSTTNLTLGDQLINDSLRYLTTKYFFNERTQVVPGGTVAGTQFYDLPYNIKTLINVYISVGDIRYQLTEAPTRSFWDSMNFVPYTSDIPQYYFIYNKQIGVFPTPASSANPITINYKMRLRDLSQADYTVGTVTLTNGSSTVTGSGTTFVPDMAGRWIYATPPTGDGNWYEIETYNSATSLTLVNQYQGTTAAGITTLIGEMPILAEDYQDLPVYRACSVYFTTRVPDPPRAELFDKLYNEGMARLDAEFGSKSWSVAITPNDSEVINPNLFIRNMT